MNLPDVTSRMVSFKTRIMVFPPRVLSSSNYLESEGILRKQSKTLVGGQGRYPFDYAFGLCMANKINTEMLMIFILFISGAVYRGENGN